MKRARQFVETHEALDFPFVYHGACAGVRFVARTHKIEDNTAVVEEEFENFFA